MNRKPSVKIIVAAHKQCSMPKDEIYFPLHVGAAGKVDQNGNPLDFGFQKDNIGENISEKNLCFGTQTALYWAWKNLDSDYIGLVHYRRYFMGKKAAKDDVLGSVLTGQQLYPMLGKYKVFVPKKRQYYIENIHDHYTHTMTGGSEQLQHVRNIIQETTSEYLSTYDTFMHQRSAYIFNMMILEHSLMDSYCSWLFPILLELEERVDTTGYTDFDKRYMGRISERLFNVWLLRMMELGRIKNEEILELPYNESVNWIKKGMSFLQAKLFKKKYSASF